MRVNGSRAFTPGRVVTALAVASVLVMFGSGVAAAADHLPTASPLSVPPLPTSGPSVGMTGRGPVAQAVVRFSGTTVGKGRPTARRVTVPVTCWWTPAPGSWKDPKAMRADYESKALGRAVLDRYGNVHWASTINADSAVFVNGGPDFAAAAAQPAGTIGWYVAVCRGDAKATEYWHFLGIDNSCPLGLGLHAFPLGRTPPPRVEPTDLARVARQVMEIPAPRASRNPTITAAGGATLIYLPTWFWVTDPAAVGGPTGTATIRAAVGPVWAEVTATTTGLNLTSEAGSATCTPAQAVTPWRSGLPDSAGCTLTFTHASVRYPKGYPVRATTTWTATWTGSDGTAGTLPTFAGLPATFEVPVAEIQAIVTNPN